jgi:uncharacterized protein
MRDQPSENPAPAPSDPTAAPSDPTTSPRDSTTSPSDPTAAPSTPAAASRPAVPARMEPISPRERNVLLDVLRGFALGGVLTGNLFWLYSGRAWHDTTDAHVLDTAARWFVMIAVQSKAQTLLTFLFGFGFAVQLVRAQERGEPVMRLYVRRLLVLLVIGWLHVSVLWWGDVTWTYAIAGFGLLLFQRASNRARIVWAVILIFIPYLATAIPEVRLASMRLFMEPAAGKHYHELFTSGMRDASFVGMMWIHIQFALVFEVPIYLSYYPWLLGRFLIGHVAGTQRWFDNNGADHLPLFRTFLIYGLVITAASVAMVIVQHADLLDGYRQMLPVRLGVTVVTQAGFLGQTAAYMAILVLLMQRPAWRRVLQIVAPAGRMPLTTYVSQSVICTCLFYGWGLGLGGRTGAAECVGIALAIFTLQIVVAHLWLRWFRFGPLEWVWRTLVYLRPQPMRV